MKFLSALFLFSLISTFAAQSHEFWISPETYELNSGENIVAAIRNGQYFSGGPFSFLPQRFTRFDLVQGENVVPVEGRIGDRPALNMAPPNDGMWVVVHQTKASKITWKEWEKFASFVTSKKLGDALNQHVERGLPDTGFSESYTRYAKALVAVGNGDGADNKVGLRTEFIALTNPYTDDLSQGFSVQLLFEDAPRRDAQIEIFAKDAAGEVTISFAQTDADGRATLPVQPGVEYLLDAVILLPLEPGDDARDPVWESLWAALTFKTPG